MITVERCRQLAPEMTKLLTDTEVVALCQSYELFADIAIEAALRKKISDPKEQNEQ